MSESHSNKQNLKGNQTQKSSHHQVKPNYGVDAPGVMWNFLRVGVSAIAVGLLSLSFNTLGIIAFCAGLVLCTVGLVSLTLGLVMVVYALRGKFIYRDYMLSLIDWQGDEMVLDVGTGRGLLMIGAAKRLTTGKAIGIDIWNDEDLSGNTVENTLKNVELEDVKDRIELMTEDVRQMSFADDSFDVILSTYCLHNIENEQEREASCLEIARVLEPGGTVLISDYIPTHDYAKAFTAAGLSVKSSKPYLLKAFAPMWMVVATKKC